MLLSSLCLLFIAGNAIARLSPPKPVPFKAEAPVRGVRIKGNSLLLPIMEANIDYLLTSFDANHMLQPFRQRAGMKAPAGSRAPIGFWDTDLLGSNAGRFLMGAGNTLRWIENETLRAMLNDIVDGVEQCRDNASGYILAYPPEGFMHSEQGDYARSWFTQGLIEAGKCGNEKVWPMLRSMYNWFNDADRNPYLPYLYDGISNGEQGQIASTRMYLETPVGVYADSQVAQDTYRDNLWMRQLIARDPAGITDYHMPGPNHAHCYEITAFLSMFDNYRATHNSTWLAAATGAWELLAENFVNVDGSSALTEASPNYPSKSYHLSPAANTGETCCTTFWIKFNQRFQQLHPEDERYAAQIETAIYNALLRQIVFRPDDGQRRWLHNHTRSTWIPEGDSQQQAAMSESQRLADLDDSLPPGIRYHATLQGRLEAPNNINTCCEGQGTRALGSLPEYIYNTASDGFYVNLFTESSLEYNATIASRKRRLQINPDSNMSFRMLVSKGWHSGAYCGGSATVGGAPPPCPEDPGSLEACKQLCLQSEQPSICMGLTWLVNPPAPPPPACQLDCTMVPIKVTGAFHSGLYNESQYADIKRLEDCKVACLKNSACAQLTWVDRPVDPCILYHVIYDEMSTVPGAIGWVKCFPGAENASCARITHKDPASRCTLFTAIDVGTPVNPLSGCEQWLVEGRRVPTEIDYIPTGIDDDTALQAIEAEGEKIAVTFTTNTPFPNSGNVSMRLDWESTSVSSVKINVRVRVPSWMSTSMLLKLNGASFRLGTPGSYIQMDRTWSRGDTLSFVLPTVYSLFNYVGVDQVAGYEGKRYALLVGPVVLACVGHMDVEQTTVLPLPPANPEQWLLPKDTPLHFNIKGVDGFEFMPLWAVPDGTDFTVYPIFADVHGIIV